MKGDSDMGHRVFLYELVWWSHRTLGVQSIPDLKGSSQNINVRQFQYESSGNWCDGHVKFLVKSAFLTWDTQNSNETYGHWCSHLDSIGE